MVGGRLLTYAIAAWSGFYVMVIELLGGRLISPFFGSSVYVWGSVIFVFMLALSGGYLLGGRLSRHASSITRLCLILIAAALTTLPILMLSEPLLNAIFDRNFDPRYGSLLACLLLFTVPTVCSGMISPYAIHLNAASAGSTGQNAGNLYFISTVGSSAGTLLTAFYFVLWFDIDTIFLGAIAISVALGLFGIIVDRMRAAAKVPVYALEK
ncbi:MAG: hypothetical protein RL490_2651 [Pseudomonadota bacterium]|jgi:hypothetical protein